jgi:hypothetical protein
MTKSLQANTKSVLKFQIRIDLNLMTISLQTHTKTSSNFVAKNLPSGISQVYAVACGAHQILTTKPASHNFATLKNNLAKSCAKINQTPGSLGRDSSTLKLRYHNL